MRSRFLLAALAVATALTTGACVSKNQPAAEQTPSSNTTSSKPTSSARTTIEQTAARQPINIPAALAPVPRRATPLPATVTCEYPSNGKPSSKLVMPPQPGSVPATGTATLTLDTSLGNVPLTLDRALAPCTVHSMVRLAGQGYFNGSSCHRISTEGLQMLQCGDPTGTGSGGPGYQFADEVFPELKYGRGILAMANSGPNTNGSQFFIVFGDAPLPPKYTVFGTVPPIGLAIVDQVAHGGHDGSLDPSPGGGKPNVKMTVNAATVS
ncbi:peptidyl-prolyl cis-trans isomerase B (cyclophilin B) [Herbihabitans rhizosphaerae]|uniref:Peptidyl-prolyl cis-trans isomerase B (Cyclophilin B) n=1 Tax=Herbihabitans rhizosphaerae TaxID=1872711 RepID=A0A4V2ERX0_9PSEU|nr:peptidylprolyl isomerase [Herbihabitans rhizosphaerae]RZS34337.1 peptidyl-prolyl cis-trans isomerase B (cyclophilin B) [Herbihabitans rhizosphaerae]